MKSIRIIRMKMYPYPYYYVRWVDRVGKPSIEFFTAREVAEKVSEWIKAALNVPTKPI